MTVKHFVVTRLFRYSPDVTLLLGLQAVIFGICVLLSNTSGSALETIMPKLSWGILFILYGIAKLISTVKCPPVPLEVAISAIGIWGWTCIFICIASFTGVPIGAIIFLLIICEVWALTSTIFNNGCKV